LNILLQQGQYDIERNVSDIFRADIMYLMLQLIWQCDNWIFYYNKANMTWKEMIVTFCGLILCI